MINTSFIGASNNILNALQKIRRTILDEVKANKTDMSLLQTKITRLAYTFQKKIEICATNYYQLWTDLGNRTRDIEAIKKSYNLILETTISVKRQWKKFGTLICKVASLVALYSQFVGSIEGDKQKSHKIFQRTNEKHYEAVEQEDDSVLEDSSVAFLRSSAEIVLLF